MAFASVRRALQEFRRRWQRHVLDPRGECFRNAQRALDAPPGDARHRVERDQFHPEQRLEHRRRGRASQAEACRVGDDAMRVKPASTRLHDFRIRSEAVNGPCRGELAAAGRAQKDFK